MGRSTSWMEASRPNYTSPDGAGGTATRLHGAAARFTCESRHLSGFRPVSVWTSCFSLSSSRDAVRGLFLAVKHSVLR